MPALGIEKAQGGEAVEPCVGHSLDERGAVRIAVTDNGPGIPDYQREQIFEPYFSTKEKGTGLGLAIVRHNTEIYGGKATVESTLGKGTTFILTFPAKTTMTAVA